MSSGAYLRLGEMLIEETRNEIDPLVMMLFRENERVTNDTTLAELDPRITAGSEDDLEITTLTYRIPLSVLRDRLELLGFTLALATERFVTRIGKEVRQHNAFVHMARVAEQITVPRDDVREDTTVDEWLAAFREIHSKKLQWSYWDSISPDFSPLIYFMLHKPFGGFGYPDYDVRLALRLMLEAFDSDVFLEYDLTELLAGGWVDSFDDLVASAEYLIAEDFVETRRIVVLTEGQTDKEFLERSLKLRMPHLAEYFAFMDFEGARIGGGSGALANMVKAFVGAGILNRILALFDNDTGGRAALATLNKLSMPDNIAVRTYPPMEFLRRYPTIGPTGIAELDVNGLAGSIELYLGNEVLTAAPGETMPVQWKGYDERLGCYQGQITHKELLHERFQTKLALCEADHALIPKYDWSGIDAILATMSCAFHSSMARAYREEADDFDRRYDAPQSAPTLKRG